MVKTRSSSRLLATAQQQEEASVGNKDEESLKPGVKELAALAVANLKSKVLRSSSSAVVPKLNSQSSSGSYDGVPLPDVLLFDAKSTSDSYSQGLASTRFEKRNVSRCSHLASSLDPGITEGLYFDLTSGSTSPHQALLTCETDELMKRSVIGSDFEKMETVPLLHPSKRKMERLRKVQQQKTAGPQWFNLSAPEMTEELKNDLKVLQMRNAINRSQHYRANDWKKSLPKHFQVGTVIEGAAEFYSARVPKKLRKRTIVEELLADEQFRKYHKKKYSELQQKFQSTSRRKHRIKQHKQKIV